MKLKYVLKRIGYAFIILFVVLTLNFLLPRLIFDDPAEPFLRGIPYDDYVLRDEVRRQFGFDGSVFYQYIRYLWRMIRFDFGYSHQYMQPVASVMFQRIPWSMVLSLTAMVISITLGIIIGAKAAKKRGGNIEKGLLHAATVNTAIPTFWIALIFVMVFGVTFGILPYRGAMTEGFVLTFRVLAFWLTFGGGILASIALFIWKKRRIFLIVGPLLALLLGIIAGVPIADLMDIITHAFMPVLVISMSAIIGYAMLVRNSMLVVVNEDYIATAKAKGLTERQVLYRHTMRNALLPMVTSIGMGIAGIFSGSVLIERIFSWPGMGSLLIDAQSAGDFPLAQGIMFFFSFITIVANLVTDLIYHKLDPRVKLGR